MMTAREDAPSAPRPTECGFCEDGVWHDPGSDRMEECPYCYGSGLANPEERFEEALRDIR